MLLTVSDPLLGTVPFVSSKKGYSNLFNCHTSLCKSVQVCASLLFLKKIYYNNLYQKNDLKSFKVQFKAEQVCASLYKFVQLCAVLCKSPAFSTKSTIPSYISTRSLYISYEASLCTTVQVCASFCKSVQVDVSVLLYQQNY